MWKVWGFINRHRVSGGLLAVAATVSACAVDQDAVRRDAPLAEVALDSGSTVSFYEPRPGTIAITQDVPAGVQPVRRDTRTAVELYASLAPDSPVPAALVAAQQRVDAARAGRPRSPASRSNIAAPTTQSFIDNKTVDDRWFVDNYCDGSYDVIKCWINRTSSVSSSQPDIDTAFYAACTDVGKVTMRVHVEDDPWRSWDILEGGCRWFSYDSGSFNDAIYGDVVNVDPGDRFHFSARYNF